MHVSLADARRNRMRTRTMVSGAMGQAEGNKIEGKKENNEVSGAPIICEGVSLTVNPSCSFL